MRFSKMAILLLAGFCSSAVYGDGSVQERTISGPFSRPESVLYNPATKTIFVSSINGEGAGKDDNGYISLYSADGRLLQEKFIDGASDAVTLHGPKGMAVSGDILWVADIDSVRKFDLETGVSKGAVEIKGSTFINDVAPDGQGGVVVTDSGFNPDFSRSNTDAIYRITQDNTLSTLIKTPDLNNPNGIAALGNGHFVIVNASKDDAVITTIDLKGNQINSIKAPYGQLDGVEAQEDGTLLITSWVLLGAFSIDPEGKVKVLKEGMSAPADLGYNKDDNVIYIPSIDKELVEVISVK